jgi:hypothetical protein
MLKIARCVEFHRAVTQSGSVECREPEFFFRRGALHASREAGGMRPADGSVRNKARSNPVELIGGETI